MCMRNGCKSGGFTPALLSFGLFLGSWLDLVYRRGKVREHKISTITAHEQT